MRSLTCNRSCVPWLLLAAALMLSGCITTQPTSEEYRRAFGEAILNKELPFPTPPGTKMDSIAVDDTARTLNVWLSPEFSYIPFRQENIEPIYAGMRAFFGNRYAAYHFSISTLRTPIEQLVPNFFRTDPARYDRKRIPVPPASRVEPVVSNTSRLSMPIRGLLNRNISLWHSHGWYYNNTEARWEWQRPRLFQSVEDLAHSRLRFPISSRCWNMRARMSSSRVNATYKPTKQ